MKKLLTIITPTYNRCKELSVLYKSLCDQKSKNFTWMIIDDGSNDDTEEYVGKLLKENVIDILFYKKNNGGKHTALNLAFDHISTDLFVVVDSDDYLTDFAVPLIETLYNKYNNKIDGIVLLKGYSRNQPVTPMFKKNEFIGNYIKDVINKQKNGDRVEVFKTKLLGENRFPIYNNENFIGEGFFWNKISKKSKLLFVNKIIYICNYLENGLTKSGRRLRISNPMGGMEHAKEYFDNIYSIKIRIKNNILYQVYYRIATMKGLNPEKIPFKFLNLVCYIPSIMLYNYWMRKYY